MLLQLKYRKKEIVIITFILLFALIATHYIYYKFKDSRNIDYNTPTLDVTFHEKSGDEINLTKVIPVSDSVGLASNAYKFTIKNNTDKSISYSINIIDNEEKTEQDDCSLSQISKNIIRFSIHKNGEKNTIYTLSNLVDGKVLTRIIKPNQKEEYTMRVWVSQNNLQTGSPLHYHGMIKVKDEGYKVAANSQ